MHVIRPKGSLALCLTCYWLTRTLLAERCSDAGELSRVRERLDYLKARISDLLRRTGVDDAEMLIAFLDRAA